MTDNIHPIFDQLLNQKDKEKLLKQYGKTFWLSGLSGSGKSTIAKGVEKKLHKMGFLTQVLDGDNIRSGINNNLGFENTDRIENIRRISEVTKLFNHCGIVTINSFVSPTLELRQLAKNIIGASSFYSIFIDTPLDICEKRDVKGLYKKARSGKIKHFTGIDAPFEVPIHPDLQVHTANQSVEESVQQVVDFILPLINYKL